MAGKGKKKRIRLTTKIAKGPLSVARAAKMETYLKRLLRSESRPDERCRAPWLAFQRRENGRKGEGGPEE